MSDNGLTVFDWSMVDLTPRACVARGSAHLDKWFPGWAQEVVLSTLDVRDCEECVLAQATKADYRVAIEIDQGRDWLVAHGFLWNFRTYTGMTVDRDHNLALIADLNAAWRTLVAARQLAYRPG
jgi:hypothetical protein